MYAKIFTQMYDGSLCTQGPWEALVTFQQLLILADQEGNVDMTAEAIARRTTIPLSIITIGIAELLKPDPKSRTPLEDGKRIKPLSEDRDWGWRVVNYKHYRGLKREQDRRDYHREYWHKRKDNDSTKTQQPQPSQPIAEAEADTEAEETHTSVAAQPRQRKAADQCPVSEIVGLYQQILPELPKIRVMDSSRQKSIQSLWKFVLTSKKSDNTRRAETPEEAMAWLQGYFGRVRDNDWLMGRTKNNGHESWKCTLDFLCSSKGLKAVIERTEAA